MLVSGSVRILDRDLMFCQGLDAFFLGSLLLLRGWGEGCWDKMQIFDSRERGASM